jgi:hypothetical protein
MNSFITYLVRRDHSLQLAAHLAAGILSLVLLSGFVQSSDKSQQTASIEVRSAAPSMLVASAINR